ncbi:MAG: MoxR family ATPase [Spirochaetales bacterium]|jgi:MoxR-like ATPase|nr:MoxR family ATPase [Spirochaetales bacterium]
MQDDVRIGEQELNVVSEAIDTIGKAISRVFVGKERVVRLLLTGFVSGLHVLIEDVPGVGKTTLARSLSASLGLDFSRIQFTPDLLPGDIVGMNVWNQIRNEFVFKNGAIMHQFILADEINRASPRTQSSLLEAMQEGSVTVDGVTHQLPDPFFVAATQNPSTFIGSFHLPEGEIDRFGISFSIGYPSEEDEQEILKRFQDDDPISKIEPAAALDEIKNIRALVRKVHVSDVVRDFIISIVQKTRVSKALHLGGSPRSAQHLQRAAQGRAVLGKRNYVIPEDVIEMAVPVLAHRVILSAESKMQGKTGKDVIKKLVEQSPVPVGIN